MFSIEFCYEQVSITITHPPPPPSVTMTIAGRRDNNAVVGGFSFSAGFLSDRRLLNKSNYLIQLHSVCCLTSSKAEEKDGNFFGWARLEERATEQMIADGWVSSSHVRPSVDRDLSVHHRLPTKLSIGRFIANYRLHHRIVGAGNGFSGI